jgi:integrase
VWLLAAQPIIAFALPKQAKPRKVRVSDEELRAIFAFLSPEARRATALGVFSELRRSELLSLRCEDVNEARSYVMLRAPG